jgi:hypothetical protein
MAAGPQIFADSPDLSNYPPGWLKSAPIRGNSR